MNPAHQNERIMDWYTSLAMRGSRLALRWLPWAIEDWLRERSRAVS